MYREELLDHFKHPRNVGKIKDADAVVSDVNLLCGDAIKLYVKIEKGVIKDIKYQSSGCAISTASASLLTEYLKGKPLEEIKTLGKDKVIDLLGGKITPARVPCALLPANALKKVVYPPTRRI